MAEFLGSVTHYWAAGFDERDDDEYHALEVLEKKILLMLNPNEADHQELERAVRKLIGALGIGRTGDEIYFDTLPKVETLSRKILKDEWDRISERTQ